MSDKENDENVIDPPSNDGGSKKVDSDSSEEASSKIDPPSNDGGS